MAYIADIQKHHIHLGFYNVISLNDLYLVKLRCVKLLFWHSKVELAYPIIALFSQLHLTIIM